MPPTNAPRRSTVRRAALVGALTLVGLQLAAAPAVHAGGLPTLRTWPSDCGGALTLQACVDFATPGDGIQVATNDVINESISISKSLTLRGADGYDPRIASGVTISAASGTMSIYVGDIAVHHVYATVSGGSGHSITVERVHADTGSDYPGIEFSAGAPATMIARSNVVTGFTEGGPGIYLAAINGAGTATLQAVGNRVTDAADGDGGAGIWVNLNGAGTAAVDVANNAIWRVGRCGCGDPSGIIVRAYAAGTDDVDIVGNTISRAPGSGVSILSSKLGGSLSVDVFDNIFAKGTSAFYIRHDGDDPSIRTVRIGHNAFWKNDGPSVLDGFSLGAGNVNGDPGFVDEASGKLALAGGSPLIDAGATCTPAGLVNLDAAKRGRLAGSTVDIGAYERGAVAPTGIAYVGGAANEVIDGTSGADIFCGMGGSDIIKGLGGADFLDGGAAGDVVLGGVGPDRVYGGKGDDSCLDVKDGVQGNDLLDGGKGDDQFKADPGDVRARVEISVSICN